MDPVSKREGLRREARLSFHRICFLMVAGSFAVVGCAKNHPAPKIPAPVAVSVGEEGVASWYGHPYHGRPTASGEVYNMDDLTAAHRTLAFGTRVRVHNLGNGKEVDVRINDRGPFVRGRILDLSRASARALDVIGPGTARVRLLVASGSRSESATTERYGVQVGAFRKRSNAERLQREMEKRFGFAAITPRYGDETLYRVLVGKEASLSAAESLRLRIGAAADAFVVHIDD